ncbi:MAG: hypothetical protein FD181_2388 [Prolixibacteraceae bacterium]|nr:MAG: hypothetical protein FD181_2388 [Prolixibacteraceae bacterium]
MDIRSAIQVNMKMDTEKSHCIMMKKQKNGHTQPGNYSMVAGQVN